MRLMNTKQTGKLLKIWIFISVTMLPPSCRITANVFRLPVSNESQEFRKVNWATTWQAAGIQKTVERIQTALRSFGAELSIISLV